VHRAHVRTEDAPFLHGEVEHIEQQTHDRKERVEHGGQPELLAEHPQAFVFEVEAHEPQRDA